MSFGSNLLVIRRKKNLTQEDLANLLDVRKQSISQWENNLSMPSVETINKISKALEVKVSDLIDNEDHKNIVNEPSPNYGKEVLIKDLMAREASLVELNALLKSTLAEKDKIIVLLEEKVKWLESKITT